MPATFTLKRQTNDNCQNALLEMSLYCHFLPLFLCLTHFAHHTPPRSTFTIVVLLRLRPLPLPLLHSVVQCQSPRSACLQAVFLIFLNYSRHFRLFFFLLLNTSSILYKMEKRVNGQIKITFTFKII